MSTAFEDVCALTHGNSSPPDPSSPEPRSAKPKIKTSVVKAAIEAALKRQAAQDAEDINVRVDGSKVTLTGSIHSFAERELATDTAWGAPGVHGVVDEMTVAA